MMWSSVPIAWTSFKAMRSLIFYERIRQSSSAGFYSAIRSSLLHSNSFGTSAIDEWRKTAPGGMVRCDESTRFVTGRAHAAAWMPERWRGRDGAPCGLGRHRTAADSRNPDGRAVRDAETHVRIYPAERSGRRAADRAD